ncbi:MAG: hypothetical protein WBR13_14085 [Allosphingosinicella sp.]
MTSTPAERESASARRPRAWWEHPALVLAAVLACGLPLLWPDVPPLVDLPGHMGRYHVQTQIDGSPILQAFYDFKWALIGNLGVDLLVVPLAALMGLEPAVKLITILIPVMTGAGFLWVAREVHGRVPPTAYFALPLTYSFPFLFGFANFALSMALAFLAFAFWLRLARLGRLKLRAGLFVPISILLWVCHAFGWGTLGVMAFSAELVRQVDMKRPLWKAGFKTGLHCLALAPPMLLMLAWRSGSAGGETSVWFNWTQKYHWIVMALRDRWEYWDKASIALLCLVLVTGLLWSKKLEYSRNLAASALFLAIVYLCLPRIVFGSNYADMRLAPFVAAAAVIAIRYRPAWAGKAGGALAAAGLLFAGARLAGNTLSFWMYDRTYDRELAAIDHIPRGARVVSFVGVECRKGWRQTRLEHLPALALVRRDAFSNDQWSMSGAQLLTTRFPAERNWFSRDPSQQVSARTCGGEQWLTLDQSLALFPRDKFTHVWLIAPPKADPALLRGLRPVWQSGTSVLYRVADPRPIVLQEPE